MSWADWKVTAILLNLTITLQPMQINHTPSSSSFAPRSSLPSKPSPETPKVTGTIKTPHGNSSRQCMINTDQQVNKTRQHTGCFFLWGYDDDDTMHYRLRGSIGSFNVQKKFTSKRLFLTQGMHCQDHILTGNAGRQPTDDEQGKIMIGLLSQRMLDGRVSQKIRTWENVGCRKVSEVLAFVVNILYIKATEPVVPKPLTEYIVWEYFQAFSNLFELFEIFFMFTSYIWTESLRDLPDKLRKPRRCSSKLRLTVWIN